MRDCIVTAILALCAGFLIGAAVVEYSPNGCTTLVLENVGERR